jgi:hypothetical protein
VEEYNTHEKFAEFEIHQKIAKKFLFSHTQKQRRERERERVEIFNSQA